MKKLFSAFLILVVLVCSLSSFSGAVSAAETAEIYLEYEDTALKQGETVTMTLNIKDNSGFGVLTVDIAFDDESLSMDSVEDKMVVESDNYTNTHIDSTVDIANNGGFYKIGWMPQVLSPGTFSSPVEYNGRLATFTFTALKDVTPSFSFNKVSFFMDDNDLTKIPYKLSINSTEVSTIESEAVQNSSSGQYASAGVASSSSGAVEGSDTASGEPGGVVGDGSVPPDSPSRSWLIILIVVLVIAVVAVIAALAAVRRGRNTKNNEPVLSDNDIENIKNDLPSNDAADNGTEKEQRPNGENSSDSADTGDNNDSDGGNV